VKTPQIPANPLNIAPAQPPAPSKKETLLHEVSDATRRIRMVVAYDGTDFHGWQVQPDLRTIQGTLEEAVRAIEGEPVIVHGSGRTDAGVHAEAQVAAFSLTNPIPVDNLRRALNRLLPPTIRILEVAETPDFHPRFDAVAKTYEYRLFRAEVCPPPLWRYVHHHPFPLDVACMIATARVFEGQHDFSAFAASDDRDAEGRSKVRTVFSSHVAIDNALLRFRIRGSGFLKHMVRNLTACLIESGKGNIDDAQVCALLQPSCGQRFPHSAPAKGLHLLSVEYESLIR
jgi:tRNA pseudouridine38-40 synthase